MNFLGISDTHEAAACLMVDGRLVACVAEERFTRLKSDMGYPRNAIEYCLEAGGLTGANLDAVLLATRDSPAAHIRIKREATFSISDWVIEQNLYWKQRFAGNPVSYYDLFSGNPKYIRDESYDYSTVLLPDGSVDQDAFRRVRLEKACEHLGVEKRKVHFITHEHCHSYYGYFGSNARERALVFTCEGEGDYSNSTVSLADPNGLKEICHTKDNHIAHFYRYVTLILGMKPNQHEYKVMGLAPYCSDYERNKVMPVFDGLLDVVDGNLKVARKIPDRYFHFIEQFQGLRFDGIAGALQHYVEDRLSEWVLQHVRETGVRTIVFSGGVAQNIKAMKVIQDLPEVDRVYVNPVSGDGSLAPGACYRYFKQTNPNSIPEPLFNVYLGPSYSTAQVEEALRNRGIQEKYVVERNPGVDRVAQLLAKDLIFGRAVGRMEFGQRALGNRSIIANPANQANVQRINKQIKGRDFWMPFTPSILDYRANDYLVNPHESHFMTVAYDSTTLAQKHLVAAIHPADFTVRPQILERARNPGYYDLIASFERITGVGGLLNTSLNLHGEPVVASPEDALHTFENSELDGMIFDELLVLRVKHER